MSSEDDDPADDWGGRPPDTVSDEAIPIEISEPVTAAHPAAALPGFEIGWKQGYDEGAANVVGQLIQLREEFVDVVRSLFVIFNIESPSWEEAEAWIRRRLPPI